MVLAGFLVICVLSYAAVINAGRLLHHLGTSLVDVMIRLMGLLLTVMAVQMVADGVGALSL